MTLIEGTADLLSYAGTPVRFLRTCVKGTVDSYLLALLLLLVPKKLHQFVQSFILVLVVACALINGVARFKFHTFLNQQVVSIIEGTNFSEISEFFAAYFSFQLLLMPLLLVAVCLLIYVKRDWLCRLFDKISRPFTLYVIVAFIINSVSYSTRLGVFSGQMEIILTSSWTPNLKPCLREGQVTKSGRSPENIVLILGESFSKSHSSLYGYEKETNPLLSTLEKDSSLVVFRSVTSDALYTIQAFQTMMSTYRSAYKDSVKWYECLTLQEIIGQTPYRSCWISNQSFKGLYDNIPSRYAELCDSMIFVGDKLAGLNKGDYDELVLPPLENFPTKEPNFLFVHLLGSHPVFDQRYPSQFNRFQEADYGQFPSLQREKRAAYDNSVLYNDSIVYRIMTHFAATESVVIYLSDHGLDIYDSSEEYCAHAVEGNSVSAAAACKIPFMVYMPPAFQERFPEWVQRFRQNVDMPYSSGDLLFTLMDLMGVSVEGVHIQKEQSILREQ